MIEWYTRIRPETVVEVGPGDGTYAKMLRPLDASFRRRPHWTAIEVWGPYVDQFGLNDLYDEVIVADVRRVNPVYLDAELVLLCDVLEHMKADEAKAVLAAASVADNMIISVPVLHLDQGAYEGNIYETHVDHWTHQEMVDFLDKEMHGRVVEQVEGKVLSRIWWQTTREVGVADL